ncbi:MAG: hypothetical protein KJ011_03795 [Burkholderiaceae bacterium]|nr:hypothetical protein [Burkholderiaceae bacterium]
MLGHLQHIDDATKPLAILRALMTAPARHGVAAEVAVTRARLRARRAILSPRWDLASLRAALNCAIDAPLRQTLGRADGPEVRSVLWRANDDAALVADAIRYLSGGSTQVREGRLQTRVRRKALGVALFGAGAMTSGYLLAKEVQWLWGSKPHLLVHFAMVAMFATALTKSYAADLKREIEVRDRLNKLPRVRLIE